MSKYDGKIEPIVDGIDSLFGLHVIDKWIVYAEERWDDVDLGNLYIVRCDMDGGNRKLLGKSAVEGIRICGPWVYTYEKDCLIRIHLDGMQKQILYQFPSTLRRGHHLAVEGDTVYFFANNAENRKMDLCAFSIPAKKLTTLRSFEPSSDVPGTPYPENFHYKDLFFPDGDSLYTAKFFYDSSSPEGVKTDILRLSRDGKQLSIAATIDEGLNTYRSLAVHNGHVYYPKRQQIMAFPLDRPDAVRILADEPGQVSITGFSNEYLFYSYTVTVSANGKERIRLVRVRLDGTGREELSSLPEVFWG